MNSLLLLCAGLGIAFLAFGYLEREPLPIGIGVGLLLLCIFPVVGLTVLMFLMGMYFLFFILIGFWL